MEGLVALTIDEGSALSARHPSSPASDVELVVGTRLTSNTLEDARQRDLRHLSPDCFHCMKHPFRAPVSGVSFVVVSNVPRVDDEEV